MTHDEKIEEICEEENKSLPGTVSLDKYFLVLPSVMQNKSITFTHKYFMTLEYMHPTKNIGETQLYFPDCEITVMVDDAVARIAYRAVRYVQEVMNDE